MVSVLAVLSVAEALAVVLVDESVVVALAVAAELVVAFEVDVFEAVASEVAVFWADDALEAKDGFEVVFYMPHIENLTSIFPLHILEQGACVSHSGSLSSHGNNRNRNGVVGNICDHRDARIIRRHNLIDIVHIEN